MTFPMRTVLFVCTGNTCRSPMAEAIARHAIDSGALGPDPDVFVASAGVSAEEGNPTTPETVDALQRLGIRFDGRSLPLTAEMIRRADVVFVMTESHGAAVRALVPSDPEAASRVVALDPSADIEDPIGQGQDAYDRLARTLTVLIPERLQELLQP